MSAHEEINLTVSSFAALGLSETLQRALAKTGYDTPTPIQSGAIPPLLDGRDLLGVAQTGTGKTAAFVLPLLQRLDGDRRHPIARSTRALILTPTRELATQIAASVDRYGRNGRLRAAVIIGGVNMRAQIAALERGVDILIATPGRLIDLVERRKVQLARADYLVIDEADRMLDIGFIRDIRAIARLLPATRQTMLFSATMPGEIVKLGKEILTDPVRVEIAAKTVAVDRIDQQLRFADSGAKRQLLDDLLTDADLSRVIVFTRTKRGADRVATQLARTGVKATAMHGDKSQAARDKALDSFRAGRSRVLVATDVAARGIDVDGVSHVINYELPTDPESYVHRIGRTARAGADGVAISFCAPGEHEQLRGIERLLKRRLTVVGAAPDTRADEGHGDRRPAGRPRQRRRRRAA
ncbi:MAG: DEAD/DEAH box helicase [Alphaproteobacteria bacterium]